MEKKAPIDPKANFDFSTKNLSPLLTSPEQFQLEMFFYNDAMEIDRNDLTLHEVLGEGAFGLVRRGVYQDDKLGTREVAVKMLKGMYVSVWYNFIVGGTLTINAFQL